MCALGAPPGAGTIATHLRRCSSVEENQTVAQPQAGGSAEPSGNPNRYELRDELARGGMGVVYRARDRVLNRVVGLKTLISPEPDDAVVQRFFAEAHITAQLQHPNIPPVHDLGTLPDGRPFLAMKLIKGDTLDVLLKARPDPAHDRGRFVAVFEHIAQGVAFAHAHNVIHRDLKPLNVMVGAFGEVQVMDWGLAKVLGAPQSSEHTDADAPAPTLVTAPTDDSDRTRAGSVMGTPAYMPREQAISAIDQLDARSDVFSLGGILCTILTGAPPYVGDSAETTRQLAAVAKLDDAFARLNACGAEPALVDLCKWCLQAESKDRPKNADVVVVAVAVLRAEAERRARQAELDRVRAEGERESAEAHTFALRKQRQLQLAILCGLLIFLAAGTGFALYRQDVRTTQERADNELVLLRVGDQNRKRTYSATFGRVLQRT
jgi:serine/threonine protein kinase